MQLQVLPIASVRPNDYNPNAMPERIRKTLKKAIERDGFLQPVLVRKDPNTPDAYIIVDGEHRWKLLQEAGYSEIPCVIVESDEQYAKIQTINMNKIKGDFDRIKMADLIVKLRETYSEEQLEELLGFERQEIRSFEDLAGFDIANLKDHTDEINALANLPDDSLPDTTDLSIPVTGAQLQIIETALRCKGGERPAALTAICHEYNLGA